jgi:hypothetical protein
MSDTDQRFAGRLVQAYSYTVPADPGWAQPDRHRDSPPEPNGRDQAPSGGGWQPAAWGESGVNVLPGTQTPPTIWDHKGTGNHHGTTGRGAAESYTELTNLDQLRAPGDSPGKLLGAGGAANGGLRADGSAPWMSPGASRRRADGGMVFRLPGFRLGHTHTPVTAEHRQGLHMNRPKIRGVRQKQINAILDNNGRPAGPIQPKVHAQLGGYTYDEAPPVAPSNAGPIGGGWAL